MNGKGSDDIRAKLDRDYRACVLKRDRSVCRVALPGCGGSATDVHHVFSRRFGRMRHDPGNGISVCRSCHSWLESNPTAGKELCREIVGRAEYQRLEKIKKREYGYV